MERLVWWAVGAAAAWTGSLLLSLWTIRFGWLAYGATTSGLFAIGAVVWKRRSRGLGSSTCAGAACSLLLVLTAVAYDALR